MLTAKYVIVAFYVLATVWGATRYPLFFMVLSGVTFMLGMIISFKPKSGSSVIRRAFFYLAMTVVGIVLTIFAVQSMSFRIGVFVFVSATTWFSAFMILSCFLTAAICANETKIEYIRAPNGAPRT